MLCYVLSQQKKKKKKEEEEERNCNYEAFVAV
jgi:hypothetical protein